MVPLREVAEMKFTQKTISPEFRDKRSLRKAIEDAIYRRKLPTLPPVEFVENYDDRGRLVRRSCDNRRLCLAKTVQGVLGDATRGMQMSIRKVGDGACPGSRGAGKKYEHDEIRISRSKNDKGESLWCPRDTVRLVNEEDVLHLHPVAQYFRAGGGGFDRLRKKFWPEDTEVLTYARDSSKRSRSQTKRRSHHTTRKNSNKKQSRTARHSAGTKFERRGKIRGAFERR